MSYVWEKEGCVDSTTVFRHDESYFCFNFANKNPRVAIGLIGFFFVIQQPLTDLEVVRSRHHSLKLTLKPF